MRFVIYVVSAVLLIGIVLKYDGFARGSGPIKTSSPSKSDRWVDEEARVVCWTRRDTYRSTSCLPCSQVAPGICPPVEEPTPSSFSPGHGGSEP